MSTPFHLHDKTILVTGASSGIGRAVAISISRMGGTCVITGRNATRLNETAGMLSGEGHQVIAADLVDEQSRTSLVAALPPLDGYVHCAGNVIHFPVKFLAQKHVDEMMKLNFESPVLLTAGMLRAKKIRNNASLVYISSISSMFPPKGGGMYSSAKAALETFMKTVAQETVHQGIRANCISPAMVQTPLYDRAEDSITKEEMDKHIEKYPLGVGQPEDVANAAIYLLSPASKWVTGITIVLDGGFLTCA